MGEVLGSRKVRDREPIYGDGVLCRFLILL